MLRSPQAGRSLALAGALLAISPGTVDAATSVARADTTRPTVSIVSPRQDQVVSGTLWGDRCLATAYDNVKVASVDFLVDGRFVNRETQRPYNCTIDTRKYSDGPHVVTAVARDGSGNSRTSSPVSFIARNTTAPAPSPTPVTPPPADAAPTPGTTLWSAGMEAGNLADWWSPAPDGVSGANGGGEFNSGRADSTASQSFRRSGAWSAKLTWTGPEESGTRLFRWKELGETRALYAEAWFYLPTAPTLTGDAARNRTVNIMQFKSLSADGARNDPFWYLVMKEKAGVVRPVLTWGAQSGLAGPAAGDGVGYRDYYNAAIAFPVGRWFRIRAYVKQSYAFDGAVSFWLDDTPIARLTGVRTGHRDPQANAWNVRQHWSVNNYSDGLAPAPFSIYVDDARIAAEG